MKKDVSSQDSKKMKGVETFNPDVFISFSKDNIETVNRICSVLELENIKAWTSYKDIVPGDPWKNSVLDAIDSSKIVVLIVSRNINDSVWVQTEMDYALSKNIKIIPFQVEKIELKGIYRLLKRFHMIESTNPPEESDIDALVSAIRNQLKKDKNILPNTTRTKIEMQPKFM